MPKTRIPFPVAFREQIVELHRGGRSAEELAREFQPCVATSRTWIKQPSDVIHHGDQGSQYLSPIYYERRALETLEPSSL